MDGQGNVCKEVQWKEEPREMLWKAHEKWMDMEPEISGNVEGKD